MISVVCWIWHGPRMYEPKHANVLRRMLGRHLKVPFRFICITDTTDGFDPEVEVMPIPAASAAVGHLRTPEANQQMPSCYRRLWMFSDEARVLGERVLLLDVDLVALNDITPLIERDEDFVGWRPRKAWGNADRVAGGMYLLRTGTHPEVWTDFDKQGIAEAKAEGFRGSDQAWLSYKLGKSAALWSNDDGLYALSDLISLGNYPPNDARIVQFAGPRKPWHARDVSWVAKHYR